jgi:LmbE family N-acetylglucosaminyl deacetylase
MNLKRPLLRRIAGAIKGRLLRLARPLLIPIRDWQAPRLHRYMMHQASVPTPLSTKPAMIIAPHHDDETFGCGGIIALKRHAGVEVDIVILTDGRQSHGNQPEAEVRQLIQTRQTEALAATAVLGVPPDRVRFFDLPDQGLRLLAGQQREDAVNQLASLIALRRPAELYITHRTDRHPDHEAAFGLTIDAIARSGVQLQVLQYPIWLIWKGPARLSLTPADLSGFQRVDVSSVQGIKNHAIELYLSQLPVLPPGFVDQFRQTSEVFLPLLQIKPQPQHQPVP